VEVVYQSVLSANKQGKSHHQRQDKEAIDKVSGGD